MLKYTLDGYMPHGGYCCFHISYFVFAGSERGYHFLRFKKSEKEVR